MRQYSCNDPALTLRIPTWIKENTVTEKQPAAKKKPVEPRPAPKAPEVQPTEEQVIHTRHIVERATR